MTKRQLHEIKTHCDQLLVKHNQDVVVESQLNDGFYNDLESLLDIAVNNDFGDHQINGHRSALDCIHCLFKVSNSDNQFNHA